MKETIVGQINFSPVTQPKIVENFYVDVVRQIIRAKNKICMKFPFTGITDRSHYFGYSESADIISFGFSYVEHEDHLVEYIIASPNTAKKIIQEIEPIKLTADSSFIGVLWTGKLYVSDKTSDNHILFANSDLSVILDLNTNKMEDANVDV